MNRNNSFTVLSLLLLTLALVSTIAAQSEGSLKQIKNCGDMTKQAFLKSAQKYTRNQAIQASIQTTLPADKYLLIDGLTQNNASKVLQSIKQKQAIGLYILHIGSVLFLMFMLVVVVPVLMCTGCCKCCGCGRRSVREGYSGWEMGWPTCCLVVLVVALIGICIAIMLVNSNYQPKFSDFKCSLGIMINDVMQGGSYPKQNIKFIGLNPLLGLQQQFISDISNIKSSLKRNMNTNSTTMKYLFQQSNLILDAVPKIPSSNGLELSLQYPKPILSASPASLYKSLFVDVLGTKFIPNSLAQVLYQQATAYNSSLDTLGGWSTNLTTLLDTAITPSQLKKPLKNSILSLQQFQFNIQSTLSSLENTFLRIYIIGSYVLLGLTILVSIIIFVEAVCLGCWNEYPCGSKLGCCCGVLWVLGVLVFGIAVVVGLGNPGLLYGCQYAREGFGSQEGYTKNIQKWVSGSQVGSIIRHCLSTSKQPSYLFNNYSLSNNANISQLSSYPKIPASPSISLTNLSQTHNETLHTIEQYRTARIYDIDDPQIITQIQSVSAVEDCFPDRWVPSLKQEPEMIIPCGGINQTADNESCEGREGFLGRGVGCVGCMDSYLVLERFTNVGLLTSQLSIRYDRCVETGRQGRITDLATLWGNYYKLKKDKIGAVKDRTTKIQTYLNQSDRIATNQLYPVYKQVSTWLATEPILKQAVSGPNSTTTNTTNTTTTPPQSSTDCRVFGKGIDNSINIVCSQGLVYLYNLRYLYTAAAIIILFICCFSVCLVSRSRHQYKVQYYRQNPEQYGRVKEEAGIVPLTERKVSEEELRSNHPYFFNNP